MVRRRRTMFAVQRVMREDRWAMRQEYQWARRNGCIQTLLYVLLTVLLVCKLGLQAPANDPIISDKIHRYSS